MRNEPVTIKVGSKSYPVGIQSGKQWESADGNVAREYLTIGSPGISEVANAYLVIRGEGMRSSDVAVDTPAGRVVWTPVAGRVSGAKRDAINEWFRAVLS